MPVLKVFKMTFQPVFTDFKRFLHDFLAALYCGMCLDVYCGI